MTHSLSRRRFIQSSAGTLALPFIAEQLSAQEAKKSANDKINLGFIGVGMMGRGHLGSFLGMGDVQVVAICDVHKVRREDAMARAAKKYGDPKACTEYTDFRKLL